MAVVEACEFGDAAQRDPGSVGGLTAICGPHVGAQLLLGPHREIGLLPAERPLIAGAVPSRRSSFAAGRRCARAVLRTFDIADSPILAGRHGQPLWPAGFVGSITHTEMLAAAAVAPAAAVVSVGIDAEPCEPLPEGLDRHIATRVELRDASAVIAAPYSDRVVFSAKEAAYKATFPLDGQVVGFKAFNVTFERDRRFAVMRNDAADTRLTGRWTIVAGHVLCAVISARTAGAVTRSSSGS